MNTVMMSVLEIIFILFVLFPTQGHSAPAIPKPAEPCIDVRGPQTLVDPKIVFCLEDKFQAALTGPDDSQYYFKVHEVYIVSKDNNVRRLHRTKVFPGSPYFVDAMTYSPVTQRVYLFKDHRVLIYKYSGGNFTLIENKRLGPVSPNILEAAFFYRGYIYLQKDGFLYEWDEHSNSVIPNHVFPTRYFWKDVPKKVAAAMRFGIGETVFWKVIDGKDMHYYTFNNAENKMVRQGTFKSFFSFCANADTV